MTAVRRLTLIACVLGATTLAAQTTTSAPKKTTKQATTPATAATTPVPAETGTPAIPESERVTAPVSADTDRDINDPRALRLSLADAISTTIKGNLNVELSRYDFAEGVQTLRGSYGIFDIFTNASLGKKSSNSAATNQFQATGNGSTFADLGATQLLPTGGTYTLGTSNSRFTQTGGGASLSPGYSTGLTFGFTQPLARDFGVDITKRNIYIARNTLGIDREFFRSALLDATNATEQAYLDLIYSRQYVDVVKEALFLARDQARITQIRIDVGASAPLDILQPRVQIATSEESLIAAVASVRSAEDRLRQLMNLPAGEWDRPIVPTDTIDYRPMTINVEESVARAYDLRPEIRQNQYTTANRRIQYNFARNQVLPTFDVTGGYGTTGAAGRAVGANGQPVPNGLDTGFGDALQQVFRRDNPGWNIGVNIGVPVFNIGARAEAKRAELDLDRSRVSDAATRQSIAVSVRQTARDVDTAGKEIGASRTAREAAERNLEAERKRYENGMTTNFNVLQIQQQLSDARARELQALVRYNQSIAAYHRAVGDLLDVRGIRLEDPAPVDEPDILNRFDRYPWLRFSSHDNAPGAEKASDTMPVPASPSGNTK